MEEDWGVRDSVSEESVTENETELETDEEGEVI